MFESVIISSIWIIAGLLLNRKLKTGSSAGLSVFFVNAVFVIKCLLGFIYMYAHQKIYGGGDSFEYAHDGLIIFNTLKTEPLKYLFLTFGPNNLSYIPEFVAGEIDAMGFWTITGSYTVVRFYALTFLFTFGNIYGSVVFMAFISTAGLVLLYRALHSYASNFLMLKLVIFAIPSVMFWSSGIHKEGIVMAFTGLFIFSLTKLRQYHAGFGFYVLMILLASCALYFTRSYILLMLLPGVPAYLLCKKMKVSPVMIFLLVYAVSFILALFIRFNLEHNRYTLLQSIYQKQREFVHSTQKGDSNIAVKNFEPRLRNLLTIAPEAAGITLVAPLLLSPMKNFQILFALENIVLLLLLLLLIIKTDYAGLIQNPMAVYFIIFSVSLITLIGIVVPNIGAIIRYRSMALLFIMLPFVLSFKPPKYTL